jgi:hypothetical protein
LQLAKYVITSATLLVATYWVIGGAKEIMQMSKPGSDSENVHLGRVERNAEAAAKGAAQGTTAVIGRPNTDGWFTFITKK